MNEKLYQPNYFHSDVMNVYHIDGVVKVLV